MKRVVASAGHRTGSFGLRVDDVADFELGLRTEFRQSYEPARAPTDREVIRSFIIVNGNFPRHGMAPTAYVLLQGFARKHR
jgi:hypothetical protein